MAPNFFSLTNIVLATSFFFVLTTATPLPKPLDITHDDMLPHPTRSIWNKVVARRPHFSTIDSLRIGETVHPSGNFRGPILLRSAAENLHSNTRANKPTYMEKVKRLFLAPHWRIGTVIPPVPYPKAQIPRREQTRSLQGPGTPAPEHQLKNSEFIIPHTRIGTTVLGGANSFHPLSQGQRSGDGHIAKKSEIWQEASFDPKERIVPRDEMIESRPIGPTTLYSGSLWVRD